MKNLYLVALLLAVLPFMAACDDPKEAPAPQNVESPKEAEKILKDRLSEWMGTWDGPEGTYLKLQKSGEGYAVIIKNLDAEQRYLGVASGMRIKFQRGETQEYIHLGSGRDTGMKELSTKPLCLILKKGEAYCRDKM